MKELVISFILNCSRSALRSFSQDFCLPQLSCFISSKFLMRASFARGISLIFYFQDSASAPLHNLLLPFVFGSISLEEALMHYIKQMDLFELYDSPLDFTSSLVWIRSLCHLCFFEKDLPWNLCCNETLLQDILCDLCGQGCDHWMNVSTKILTSRFSGIDIRHHIASGEGFGEGWGQGLGEGFGFAQRTQGAAIVDLKTRDRRVRGLGLVIKNGS
ncbi:hypothetical protein Tco_0917949 [Tanacetum coccineum]